MIYQLNTHSLVFPDPRDGDEDGMVGIGGDLSSERLLLAYSLGYFPWFSFRRTQEPEWFCPMERFVIFPPEIHISHSMRNIINRGIYRVSINEDFQGVINGCAEGRIEDRRAWLGEEMIEAYTRLHRLGFASSVEVWREERLVGGLYGVMIASTFFGESMFSREPGTSKLALIHLCRTMEERGGLMVDCQFETPHLKSMGGRRISYDEFMKIVRQPTWMRGIDASPASSVSTKLPKSK